jgi:Zn-dependent protease
VDDRPAAARQVDPSPQPAGNGVRIGRPFGVPVYLTPSWFLLAALLTIAYAPLAEDKVPDLGVWKYAVSASFAALLCASVLAHELAHTVAALRAGLPVRSITLFLLGGVSEIEKPSRNPRQEAWIAGVGPLMSLVLALVAFLVTRALPEDTLGRLFADGLLLTNLFVGAFNLLPGLPLDGGRVLSAAVWQASGRRETGTVAAAWVGRGVAVVTLLLPATINLVRGVQPDLIDLVWGAVLASFIWSGANQALVAAKLQSRIPGLSARTLTRRAIPVAADLPLAEAMRRAAVAGARNLVIVDGNGDPTGLVNEAAALATPEARRPWVPVGDVSRRLQPGMVVSAELTGEDLVAAITASPAAEYLVVETTGHIYGVLMTADVERAVATAS